LIFIKGFDDTFSQVVHSRYSYTMDEIIWGARFTPPFYTDERGEIIFDLENVHNIEKTELNK
ncbi:MAG: potassium transporter, partial [Ignavibacteriaceae bacterium]